MYETHFGLTGKPFSIVPNPEILYLSKKHENAITYLEYGLSEKVGFILLTGEIGTGKTTLVRHMLHQMESQMDIAVIFNTNFSSDQLFRLILNEFDIVCEDAGKEALLEALYRFLIDRYAQGRHVLLVIDEAQNLSAEALEDIRMLSNLQTDDRMLLQIMLVGQPELRTRLQMPDLRQLAQRIAVNYHLAALDREQTARYIAYRVESVGGRVDLFSPEAVRLIYNHTGGVPRTVNLLCDAAMVYAYSDDRQQIDVEAVESVLRDNTLLAVTHPDSSESRRDEKTATLADKELGERLAAVEAGLTEIRLRHESLCQKVRHELVTAYQDRLATERKRYDQLMARHTQLLQLFKSKVRNGKVVRADPISPVKGARDAENGNWRGMIGRVLKGGKAGDS